MLLFASLCVRVRLTVHFVYIAVALSRQALHEFGLDDPAFVAFFLPLMQSATPMIQTILEQTSMSSLDCL